jgi:ParB-like chromosome segregation protein Spo0J
MSERLKIADLKFDPQNARVRTAKGEAMIQESLRSVGAARSIVIDEDGTILAGNGTVEAAGQVGIENVVIVEASGDEIIAVKRVGLTDEQKKKLAYYDNRTGDEAEWDMEQVARDLLGGYEFLDELFDELKMPEEMEVGSEDQSHLLDDSFEIIVTCSDESDQAKLLEEFEQRGYECRAIF